MRFRTSWLARLLRGRRLDRNPLRRGSDRAETFVIGGLAGPQVPRPSPAVRLGRGVAGERAAVEPAALGPAVW